jgi:hypothetical protein
LSLAVRASVAEESAMSEITKDNFGGPQVVDRSVYQPQMDGLRIKEKAHTRAGDALAADDLGTGGG